LGILIVGLFLLKQTGFSIAVRQTQDIFSTHIGSLGVISWLLILCIVLELIILILLYLSKRV
jgi:hypothetical protein